MIIPLTKGKVTLIDDEDWPKISANSWSYSKGGYAVAKVKGKIVFMHRIIMQNPNYEVDHINGEKLDNRKSNLRLCTHTQNCKNRTKSKNKSSKYKSVSFDKKSGKWRARLKIDYKETNLGFFVSEREAAEAYNRSALHYFGKFAKLNLIEGDF